MILRSNDEVKKICIKMLVLLQLKHSFSRWVDVAKVLDECTPPSRLRSRTVSLSISLNLGLFLNLFTDVPKLGKDETV